MPGRESSTACLAGLMRISSSYKQHGQGKSTACTDECGSFRTSGAWRQSIRLRKATQRLANQAPGVDTAQSSKQAQAAGVKV